MNWRNEGYKDGKAGKGPKMRVKRSLAAPERAVIHTDADLLWTEAEALEIAREYERGWDAGAQEYGE